MNREDIIRMAREAGLHAPEGRTYILSPTIHPDDDLSEYLERFAALVASAERERIQSRPWGAGSEWIVRAVEAEREACAKVCEDQADDGTEGEWDGCCLTLAKKIRARGQA